MRMLDLYTSNCNGVRENLINETRESFEEYLEVAPTRHTLTVLHDNRVITGSLQDATFNNRTYGDEKVFVCSIDTVLEIGDYMLWKRKPYLVTNEDINPTMTHKTFILRPCNNVVNIKAGNKIKPLYIIADNVTAKFKETDKITTANDTLRIIFGNCELSKNIVENYRLIIKDKVWNVTTIEDLTGNYFEYKGITYAYIRRELKTEADDVTTGVANNKVDNTNTGTANKTNNIMDNMFGKR